MPFVDVRGVRVFFTDDGAGDPPMIFIHGFSCDSHDWSWQLPHFEATHRIIAVDLRGHGRSSVPAGGYDVLSFAADVIGLLEHLAIEPVVVVGHSLGGAIAASIAVERPDLVTAVVAIDPGHLFPDEAGPMLATFFSAYERDDPVKVAQAAFDQTLHTAATPAALATWHNRRVAGLPAHVIRETMRGLIGGEKPFILRATSEPYLARVRCPVLSFYVDPARAALADKVFPPPSKTVCLEAAGHWLHQERPAEVNGIIDTWLAGLGGGLDGASMTTERSEHGQA